MKGTVNIMVDFIQRLNVRFTDEEKEACLPIIDQILDFASLARSKGLLALEEPAERIGEENPFFMTAILYVVDAKAFLDLCESMGIKIVDLHASGHAYRNQLEETVQRLKPRVLVPIHTENAELFAEHLHDNVVTINDGELYEI
jgi:flagellar motor component MotA